MRYRLGIIGCGNMAQAIVSGAVKRGVLDAASVIASDPSEENRAVFEGWGCTAGPANTDVAARAEQVLLAVKPQVFPGVAEEIGSILSESQVLISIMAGVSSAKITALTGKPCRVVRVMPNTPALVGEGLAGIALGEGAQPGDEGLARQLFAAVGEVVDLDEPMIDAINAVSGSGPGYVFYFAQAMEQMANQLGLAEDSRRIVAQTFFGAGKLMLESGEDPAELRRKVTSPGGTTQAACELMDDAQVMDTIAKAMQAAYDRAVELGQ